MYSLLAIVYFIRLTNAIDVGGQVLHQNTIWTKTNNPYNVIGDIHVPRNVTLTIESGVTIIFNKTYDYEMLIKGFLRIQGKKNDSVVFNGTQAIQQSKWMITFKRTHLSHSSIIYARFLGPKRAVQLADVAGIRPINTGEVIFQHCEFNYTEIGLVSISFNQWTFPDIPILTIQNSKITYSTIQNMNNAPQMLRIVDSHIENLEAYLMGGYHGIRMFQCTGENISMMLSYTTPRFLEIENSNLKNLSITIADLIPWVSTSVLIKRSNLVDAWFRMIDYKSEFLMNFFHIISSKITVSKPMELELGLIEHSSISSFNNNSNSIGIIARSISIIHSSIFDFSIGLRILPYRIPMGTITNNNFYYNKIFNIENLATFDLDVKGNWWGTKLTINDKLFDYWDNINYGEIKHINDAEKFIRSLIFL